MADTPQPTHYLIVVKSSCSETDEENSRETTVYLKKKEHGVLVASLASLFKEADPDGLYYGDIDFPRVLSGMESFLVEDIKKLYVKHGLTLTDDAFSEYSRWVLASPMVVEEGCDYHRKLGLFDPYGGRWNDNGDCIGWFTRKVTAIALRTCTHLTPEVDIGIGLDYETVEETSALFGVQSCSSEGVLPENPAAQSDGIVT